MSMEKPKNIEEYNIFEQKGINVYIKKDIKAKKDLITFTLSSFLFLKSIEAQGIEMF